MAGCAWWSEVGSSRELRLVGKDRGQSREMSRVERRVWSGVGRESGSIGSLLVGYDGSSRVGSCRVGSGRVGSDQPQ